MKSNLATGRGMTLVEILVAIGLFAILLGGLGPLIVGQVRQAGRNVTRNRLSVVASNVLEHYQSLSSGEIASLVGVPHATTFVSPIRSETVYVSVDITQPDTTYFMIRASVTTSSQDTVEAYTLRRRER